MGHCTNFRLAALRTDPNASHGIPPRRWADGPMPPDAVVFCPVARRLLCMIFKHSDAVWIAYGYFLAILFGMPNPAPRAWNHLAKSALRSPLRSLRHTHQKSPMAPTQSPPNPGGSELCAEVSGSSVDEFDESLIDEFHEVVASIGGGVKGSRKMFFGNGPEQTGFHHPQFSHNSVSTRNA